MWKPKIGWPNTVALVVVLRIALCMVAPLVSIAWNLTVRAGRGRQLAESLQQKHPALVFTGSASYEGAHLHIRVKGDANEKEQRAIIDWLERLRQEKGLTETISVGFMGELEFVDYRFEASTWQKYENREWRRIP